MNDSTSPLERSVETFESLSAVPGLIHGFFLRNPVIDVNVEREEALIRLKPCHDSILAELGIKSDRFWTGDQVHGDGIFVCDGGPSRTVSNTDGFVTGSPGTFLGIYVADCAAVFIVDPVKRACGLVHSGKKGSEAGIAGKAIEAMKERFGSNPEDLIVQVSPCIRPPIYETDFVSLIREACEEVGVQQFFDSEICTGSDLSKYYSYRVEMGKTGRMLAILGFEE